MLNSIGSSKEDIWRKLADELHGKFIDGKWSFDKVQVEHDCWTITLDSYAVVTGHVHIPMTRFRAPFVNPEGFRFSITRQDMFTGLQKIFGMQDIEIGADEFDHDFVIQANDEPKIKLLLQKESIREKLKDEEFGSFEVIDDEGWFSSTKYPADTDLVIYTTTGEITDKDRLKKLFELFAQTLDQLCAIGSAYHTRPDVEIQ